jgi:hypothetical protein
VEPVGAADRPPVPAQPGRPRALPPRAPWTEQTGRKVPAAGSHRTAAEARRRHARRFVSDAAIERLEELEAGLLAERTSSAA